MFPKPLPELFPNTFDYESLPMVKPTGFREYDARWFFGKELNLMGVQAVGMGLGRNSDRRGISTINFGKPEPESRLLETVKAALAIDGDANVANQAGDTALHAAAQSGFDTIVQYLVDHGAHVNAKNKQGRTPLAAAMQRGGRGRGGARGGGGGDPTGVEEPRDAPASSTAALLRKLGATE